MPLCFTDCWNLSEENLIQEFRNYGTLFKIEFEITVNNLGSGWTNILHFTQGKTISESGEVGNRIPGIWMADSGNFYIENDFCNFDSKCGFYKGFDLNTKYKIKIQQYLNADNRYVYEVIYNGVKEINVVFPEENKPKNFPNVKLYASGWDSSFAGKGSICNVKINFGEEDIPAVLQPQGM